MSKGNGKGKGLIIIILIILAYNFVQNVFEDSSTKISRNGESPTHEQEPKRTNTKEFVILSSYENEPLETSIKKCAKKNKIDVEFIYKGDIDIVKELNSNSNNYDAVWISNSMWLYMLDNSYLLSDSKSVSISPVVFGIRKSKAQSLGLVDKDITNNDILKLIQDKKISYVMNSVTSTNTGATAYFGFLNTLAGNPEVLTTQMLDQKGLQDSLMALFSGVERVSGDENFLQEMFINNDDYEAVIADESSLIDINQKLSKSGKEELYLLYPIDGVAVNDSTFAYVNNGYDKEEKFLILQQYLLSAEGQKLLSSYGKRTWYGGVNNNADKTIFNPKWGIDTTKYLNVTRFPSKEVMTYSLNLYIDLLRKPSHTVFVLDYSGSMHGSGINELINAMDYILDYDKASKDSLQFSKKDKITIIPFNTKVRSYFSTDNGRETQELLYRIKNEEVYGTTALYDAVIAGLDILENESDEYTTTIIAMTDGVVNEGSYSQLSSRYNKLSTEIPVYSITFGDADETQLYAIARLSNARVFDGKTNLLDAFKEVRGYN